MTDTNQAERSLASRWARLGGALVDTLAVLAIVVPLTVATGMLQAPFSAGRFGLVQQVGYLGIWLVAFLVLNGYLLIKRGLTIS